MVKIIYEDDNIVICIKPSGALSTDSEGGMPGMLKEQLGCDEIKTVHRLDRVVSGLMVFAKNQKTASNLGSQIQSKSFKKTYFAVVHGIPKKESGRYTDLLFRDTSRNMTFVVGRLRKGVRLATLEYEVIATSNDLSLVKINLLTGRTHQIRVQFSSRKMPVVGDRKYGAQDDCPIALWSSALSFNYPDSKSLFSFNELPPNTYPWKLFPEYCCEREQWESELPSRQRFRNEVLIN